MRLVSVCYPLSSDAYLMCLWLQQLSHKSTRFKIQQIPQIKETKETRSKDEMFLQAQTHDPSSGTMFGSVTLPGHRGTATHGLVSMLSGICVRWKQIVAFYYTSYSSVIFYLFDACFLKL